MLYLELRNMPYRSGFTHFILVLRINQSVRFPVNEEFTNMHDLKIHQCPECDFKVTRKENVKLHILRVHKREFNFQCSQCPKQYPIKSELNSHIQSKHNERTLECPHCDKKFSVHKNLKYHIERYHNENAVPKEKLQCVKCDYKTTVKRTLQDHIDVKHDGVKPNCTFCAFQSTSPQLLRHHIKLVHRNGSLTDLICEKCGFKGLHWNDFKTHLKTTHFDFYKHVTNNSSSYEEIYNNPVKRNVKCTHCDKTFSFLSDMKIHVKAVHEGVKYSCDQCEFQCGYKSFLRKHIKRVHELYRDKCSQCDEAFDDSSALKDHIQVIHDGLLFNCDICDHQFKRKKERNRHKKIQHENVEEENRAVCSTCNIFFASQVSLKRHMKKHTNSFPCPFCEFETSQEAVLRNHITDNHSFKKGKKISNTLIEQNVTVQVKTETAEEKFFEDTVTTFKSEKDTADNADI